MIEDDAPHSLVEAVERIARLTAERDALAADAAAVRSLIDDPPESTSLATSVASALRLARATTRVRVGAEIVRLRKTLEGAKRKHDRECPADRWLCDCGASEHNARIDAALDGPGWSGRRWRTTMPSESLSAFCARLEALAAKATPGPWISTYETDDPPVGALMGESVIETRAPGISDLERMVVGTTYYDGTRPACCAEDARYLAALDPATVLRLCAAVEAAGRLAEVLEERNEGRGDIRRTAAALAAWESLAGEPGKGGDDGE